MRTKLKAGALLVVLLGVAALLLVQQRRIGRLTEENAALRAELNQLASLRESNEQLNEQLKSALEAAQTDRDELTRLRGQSVRVRQLEQENAQLKVQAQQLAQQMRETQSAAVVAAQATVLKRAAEAAAALDVPEDVTDLGLIELSDGVAVRFDIGGGTNCVVTPKVRSDGNVHMVIALEATNPDGIASELGQSQLIASTGLRCTITVNERRIGLVVTLKAQ